MAWDRFFCVTCQKEHPIGERLEKTVYKGSKRYVKIMCIACYHGRRPATLGGYSLEDDEDFQIPQNIVESYQEQSSADS